ncbi:MAG: ABC transporter permease [Candidatus Edwardsbacteria bacterium]|nr:ABC transporter permease [Candidatus Edwardsbacteria bacterium]
MPVKASFNLLEIVVHYWESIKLAFEAIRSHKLRSGLTTLGILIGVLAVIVMMSMIDGLNRMVTRELDSIGSTTLYVQKSTWGPQDASEYLKVQKRKNLTLADAYAIRDQCPSVRRVAPNLHMTTTVKYRGQEALGVHVNGTTPDDQYIGDYEIDQGRPMSYFDVDHKRQVCLIGPTIAEKLALGQDPIGRNIIIEGKRFEVIALLKKQGVFLGNDKDSYLVIPITAYMKCISGAIREHGGFGTSVQVVVQPVDIGHVASARDEITELLRRRRRVPPSQPDDFSINSADQLMAVYRSITAGIFGLMIGVTFLSLLVGGIGIMNIMMVSVSERTREIGIRKAIGARKRDILRQFLVEAVALSSVGGLCGMILGFVLAALVSLAIKLPSTVTWWSVLLGFGFSAAVGIFFGWYPARKAADLDPIEALRYE